MGAEPAFRPAALPTSGPASTDARATRLRGVAELLRIYEDLNGALGRASDEELARLSRTSRAGERCLREWARRIETFRRFKRGFEAGVMPDEHPVPLVSVDMPAPQPWTVGEPRAFPFMWEAVAFVVGFGVSFLLT